MGGPILIKAREEQCRGAGPCSEPRELTEIEVLKYYTKEEIEKLSKKKEAPEKEKLIEALSEQTGKTKSIIHAARKFHVSGPIIYNWMKEYGIQFGDDGKVVVESKPEAKEETQQAAGDGITDDTAAINAGALIISKGELIIEDVELDITRTVTADEISAEGDTITITGQETKKLMHKVGYAEYDIGNTVVQIDFRRELVNIGKNSEEPISFEEAIAAAELILDILDHE